MCARIWVTAQNVGHRTECGSVLCHIDTLRAADLQLVNLIFHLVEQEEPEEREDVKYGTETCPQKSFNSNKLDWINPNSEPQAMHAQPVQTTPTDASCPAVCAGRPLRKLYIQL